MQRSLDIYCPDHSLELNQLTGIAAILTFPLDIEVVEAEEREAKEEAERVKEEQLQGQ